MKSFSIDTPAFQNWSCHGCTDCCRGLMVIELSEEEKKRIEGQGWTQADGVNPETMIIAEGGGFRLEHQKDGACVFLDAAGRCRIHSRFGEPAKPRACRLFPIVFHPAGKKLALGLRFSCPSAVANSGKPLSEQLPDLRKLAAIVVPDDYAKILPPPVLRTVGLEWPDFLRFIARLDKTLSDANKPVALKLQQALYWLKEIEKAEFDQITGPEADEILSALAQNAAAKTPAIDLSKKPTRFGRLLFRTLAFVYARKDTMKDAQAGGRYRLKMLWAMLRFANAAGNIPTLHDGSPTVKFAALEKSFGPIPTDAEVMLTRFFRVKIQSLHFCGRAYYDVPLIEGFQSLALLYPAIAWLARWQAAGAGRSNLCTEDIARAIAMVDHHHGYSPILGTSWARQRVRLLAQRDDIRKLCGAFTT